MNFKVMKRAAAVVADKKAKILLIVDPKFERHKGDHMIATFIRPTFKYPSPRATFSSFPCVNKYCVVAILRIAL